MPQFAPEPAGNDQGLENARVPQRIQGYIIALDINLKEEIEPQVDAFGARLLKFVADNGLENELEGYKLFRHIGCAAINCTERLAQNVLTLQGVKGVKVSRENSALIEPRDVREVDIDPLS